MDHLTPGRMDAYRLRRLSPDALLQIDAHLASCEECRTSLTAALADAGDASSDPRTDREVPHSPHLTYEDLEAYLERRLGESEREIFESHVELCGPCRDELADLSAFVEAFKRSLPAGRLRRTAARARRPWWSGRRRFPSA